MQPHRLSVNLPVTFVESIGNYEHNTFSENPMIVIRQSCDIPERDFHDLHHFVGLCEVLALSSA